MAWTSALAIFFLFWVFSAFFVLPFHGRRHDDDAASVVAGADSGAPAQFRPRRILVQVTMVALVSFGIWYVVYTNGYVDPDAIADAMGRPR